MITSWPFARRAILFMGWICLVTTQPWAGLVLASVDLKMHETIVLDRNSVSYPCIGIAKLDGDISAVITPEIAFTPADFPWLARPIVPEYPRSDTR